MKPDRFRTLAKADGPFASVYFDDSRDTEDAATKLDVQWKDIAAQLQAQGADDALVQGVRDAYADAPAPAGRHGRGVIVGRDVAIAARLDRVPEQLTARVSTYPFIVPVVEHGSQSAPYLVVAVDHLGADVTVHRGGRTVAEVVESGAVDNVRAAAERVVVLTDDHDPEVVFVVGEVRSRTDFVADLPQRVAERVVQLDVGARHAVDEDTLRHEIGSLFEMRHAGFVDDVARRFDAELARGSGLATEGLLGVCGALRDGAVETLVLGDLGDATVLIGDPHPVLAPNADVLSELGSAPGETVRADEALPMAAVAIDADVVVVGDRTVPRDGVGAILRYAPRTSGG